MFTRQSKLILSFTLVCVCFFLFNCAKNPVEPNFNHPDDSRNPSNNPSNPPPPNQPTIQLSPPAPINFNSVELKWTCSNMDPNKLKHFEIWMGTSPGNYQLKGNSGKNTSFQVSNLTPNTNYFFVIKAIGYDGGILAMSNEVSFNLPNPPTIQLLPPTPMGFNSVRLDWTYSNINLSEIMYFEIWMGTSPGNYQYKGNSGQNTSFQVDNLTPNTTYYFVIKAIKIDNTSFKSNEVSYFYAIGN
ncbi:fibronectin type III domain-containing protein [bacterium]|nr:fibronectin type III domain-containing protein [bacterium]MBU1152869.1 fibronectin type III domain-containing protein [bacterium]